MIGILLEVRDRILLLPPPTPHAPRTRDPQRLRIVAQKHSTLLNLLHYLKENLTAQVLRNAGQSTVFKIFRVFATQGSRILS